MKVLAMLKEMFEEYYVSFRVGYTRQENKNAGAVKKAPALNIDRFSDFSSASCHRWKLPFRQSGRRA